jgi:hypothetical protein
LNRAGFRNGPKKISKDDLTAASFSFDHIEGRGVGSTLVAGGELRALYLQPLDATEAHWRPILLRLKEFAASIGAQLE